MMKTPLFAKLARLLFGWECFYHTPDEIRFKRVVTPSEDALAEEAGISPESIW